MKVKDSEKAVQTWYLIQPEGFSRPWWFTKPDRRYWDNAVGGIRLCSKTDRIISKVRCRFDDLDHSVTGLLVPDSKYGWLSPAVRFYGCTYGAHHLLARHVLKRNEVDLEEEGWIRVMGNVWLHVDSPRKATPEQRNWLSARGYTVPEN